MSAYIMKTPKCQHVKFSSFRRTTENITVKNVIPGISGMKYLEE